MNEKRTISSPAVGGSSLLAILGVLCLVIFALLCLTTAQAEKRLSDAAAQNATAFYDADTRAEEIFAQLRNGEKPDPVTQTGDLYAYSCPISEHQTLSVLLRRDGDTWTVLRWQAVAADITVEETMSLWTAGENP